MHDLHIGDFCKDAAGILILLYRRFPQKTTLYIEDIIGPDTPDEFGLHSPRHMACFGTAVWLAEENLFRFGQPIKQEALDEVVLSAEALLHFSATEENSDSRSSRINLLEDILLSKDSTRLNNYLLQQLALFKQRI